MKFYIFSYSTDIFTYSPTFYASGSNLVSSQAVNQSASMYKLVIFLQSVSDVAKSTWNGNAKIFHGPFEMNI